MENSATVATVTSVKMNVVTMQTSQKIGSASGNQANSAGTDVPQVLTTCLTTHLLLLLNIKKASQGCWGMGARIQRRLTS